MPLQERQETARLPLDQIKELREKISRKDAERSLAILKVAGESAIEMTESAADPSISTIQEESNASSQNAR